MNYRKEGSETFFSQWIPLTIIFGLIAAFIISAILLQLARTNRFEYGSLILVLLPVLLWMICFRMIRFERDRVILYYFGIFPSRIDYAEVCRYIRLQNQVLFLLRSGKRKSWNMSFFSSSVCEAIMHELGSRIRFPETAPEIPDIRKWTDHALQVPLAEKTVLCLAAVAVFVLGTISLCSQLAWNERVRTWDKATGIILKNDIKRVKSGRHSRNVADVAYKYTYKGRQYTGKRIVYDSETFPDWKAGSRCRVIVNPKDPRDCAIMFRYRGKWGLIRYLLCTFCYLTSIVVSSLFFRRLSPKKTVVPESLKKYIASFSPERFYSALGLEQPAAVLSNVEMRHRMEYRQDQRYGIIRQRDSVFCYIVFGAALLLAVAASLVIPVCWFVVAVIGFIIYSMYAPRMTVFDFQEKKICFSRRFDPEKFASMKSLSFSEIDHLSISTLFGRQQGKYIGLFAVKRDGSTVPLCKVSGKHLDLLLELLPELAEKMGHLPVIYY